MFPITTLVGAAAILTIGAAAMGTRAAGEPDSLAPAATAAGTSGAPRFLVEAADIVAATRGAIPKTDPVFRSRGFGPATVSSRSR